ncbi:carbonic anhydrase [Histoplasma ohiense]|nr:carbonic anhydrase [Histoplasma ohiense (nom. inval.)]
MGSGLEPFPDTPDRVAWEVEGFLIACWLGLQDDTEQVLYTLPTGTYQIDKKSKDSVLRQFLIDEDILLRRGDR